MSSKRPPTKQQKNAIDAVAAGKSIFIQALAGTGKSFTLIEAATRLWEEQPGKTVLLTAFNVKIKSELEGKLIAMAGSRSTLERRGWAVRTLNGLGHGVLLANKFGGANGLNVNPHKNYDLLREAFESATVVHKLNSSLSKEALSLGIDSVTSSEATRILSSLIDSCKIYGVLPHQINAKFLEHATRAYRESTGYPEIFNLTETLAKFLGQCLHFNLSMGKNEGIIDFNDQPYLSVNHCASPGKKWDVVIADEVQDSSEQTMKQLSRSCRDQIILAGDEHQVLYQTLRGANINAVLDFVQKRNMEVYPLTVTFRCAQSIAVRQVEFGPLDEFIPALGDKAPVGDIRLPYFGSNQLLNPAAKKTPQSGAYWTFRELLAEPYQDYVFAPVGMKTIKRLPPSSRSKTQPKIAKPAGTFFLAAHNATLFEALALLSAETKTSPDKLEPRIVLKGQQYPKEFWKRAVSYRNNPRQAPDRTLSAGALLAQVLGEDADGMFELLELLRVKDEARPTDLLFSTVHSTKGAEADKVVLLDHHLMDDTAVKYVAETRARLFLFSVVLGHHAATHHKTTPNLFGIATYFNTDSKKIPVMNRASAIDIASKAIPAGFLDPKGVKIAKKTTGAMPRLTR